MNANRLSPELVRLTGFNINQVDWSLEARVRLYLGGTVGYGIFDGLTIHNHYFSMYFLVFSLLNVFTLFSSEPTFHKYFVLQSVHTVPSLCADNAFYQITLALCCVMAQIH